MIETGIADYVNTLESDAAEFAELVTAFPFATRLEPFGDEFCMIEHACHLRDLERDGFAPRVRSVIEEEDPLLHNFDGGAVAAASNYREQDPIDAINAFLEARKRTIDALRAMPQSAFSRTGHYEGRAPITLADVVAGMIGHDDDHLGRLRTMLAKATA
jgi:hypothetical protein